MMLPRERVYHATILLLMLFVSWRAFAADQSLLKGIIDGCIDGQRRQHAAQGITYDAELVRHYCYCQAANLSVVLTDPTARSKYINQEPAMMKRMKAISDACADGVRNGRRFAPE
jgi:hypothetical protein